MKLSIIVPIYNAEKYLHTCLDSIENLSSLEWECLLINDGSHDSSLEILKEYSDSNKRFRVFNIKNAGVSNARNVGINEATGDVCLFLDSDDWLTDSADRLLWERVSSFEDNTCVIYAYDKFFSTDKTQYMNYPDINDLDYKEKIKKLAVQNQFLNTCWGKLFDLNLIKEYNIVFDENLKIGEDACFVMEYLKYAKSIIIDSRSLMFYRLNASGAMRNAGFEAFFDEEKVFNYRNDMITSLNLNVSKDEYSDMCATYFDSLVFYTLSEGKKKKIKKFYEEVKKYYTLDFVRHILQYTRCKNASKIKILLLRTIQNDLYIIFAIFIKLYSYLKK